MSAPAPSDTTRFGSPWQPLERAASTLRARAARHGVALRSASREDLAAAVIGAEAWMVALGADRLENPSRYGIEAVEALAAVAARAAGCAGRDAPLEEDVAAVLSSGGGPVPEVWLAAAARWDLWLGELGVDPAAVFSRVVCDLTTGSPPLLRMASALLCDAAVVAAGD